MSDRLGAVTEKVKSSEEQRAKLQVTVDSYKVDYKALLTDYYYIEDQYNNLRTLFKKSITVEKDDSKKEFGLVVVAAI